MKVRTQAAMPTAPRLPRNLSCVNVSAYKRLITFVVRCEAIERAADADFKARRAKPQALLNQLKAERLSVLTDNHRACMDHARQAIARFRQEHPNLPSSETTPDGRMDFYQGPTAPAIDHVETGEKIYKDDQRADGIPDEFFVLDWKKVRQHFAVNGPTGQIRGVFPEIARVHTGEH